jgi:hypothetical protein
LPHPIQVKALQPVSNTCVLFNGALCHHRWYETFLLAYLHLCKPGRLDVRMFANLQTPVVKSFSSKPRAAFPVIKFASAIWFRGNAYRQERTTFALGQMR